MGNKREYYVYKYTYYGAIIYVGQTTCLSARHNQHMQEKQFIELDKNKLKLYYFKVNHSVEKDVWETLLINKYKPAYNKAKKFKRFDQRLLSFEEPTWDIYGLGSNHNSIKETLIGLRKANELGLSLNEMKDNLSKGEMDVIIDQTINEEISDYLSKQIVINYQDINMFYRTKKVLKLITFDKLPKGISKPELDRILYLTFDEEKVYLDSLDGLHVTITEDEDNYYVSVIKKNNNEFKNYWYDVLNKIFDKTDRGVWMNVIDKSLIKEDFNKKENPMILKNILPTKKDISKN